ncbi:hypothetical protein BDR07DRAFT_1405295 [Suillus spraguei]|nr:hypothetical protein BDR07DRAFT_1405295 [Suillus spraguei]
MGIDVPTFSSLLTAGFAQAWYETPIPREDVSAHGTPRIGKCSLDAAGALGLALHYLNSTMHAISLQQIFAIIPTKIQWPGGLDFERCSALVVARHPRLGGAFGSIDGLKLPVQYLHIQTSEDVDIENATFNGWLSKHFISSVLAFQLKATISSLTQRSLGAAITYRAESAHLLNKVNGFKAHSLRLTSG